jgi:hypothetical protein
MSGQFDLSNNKSNRRTHAFAWVPAPMDADKRIPYRRPSAFIGGCFYPCLSVFICGLFLIRTKRAR